MFRPCEVIIKLPLEHLKRYKNFEMLQMRSHFYKLFFIFPSQFEASIKLFKKKTKKAIGQRGLWGKYVALLSICLSLPVEVWQQNSLNFTVLIQN